MAGFSYSNAPGIVRDDLYQAHHNMWQRLAKPGTWWTGAERVAIAAEVRKASDCKLCKDRMAALSPNTVKGQHDRSSDILPESAVDVIHRVVTDSGRLSKGWFEKILSHGLNDAQYIEIIGTVIGVMSIDTFCKGVGIALHPLPKPLPGKPSYQRPSTAKQEDAWVPMISVKDAIGAEADLFNGKMTGNVMRALSLVPDEVRGLNKMSAAQYLPINKVMRMDTGRVLNRAQIELIASRVSAINECFY
jgi:hypothetical protein